ncbi:hypothetical protein GJR98_17080 [Haloferax sp. MBLA0077]|uniref:JAB domain-containing protein n=3 Tax=Haloferacaceae TaxID=1644056 RepID=A0A6G1Z7G1_9EURY|nr:hypothetical protein Hfx1149_17110 [Haloferax sp. CBA1149]MRW82415.1 hypothetical protein [Haloferax marinisediminis]
MFQLDDPEYYKDATIDSLTSLPEKVAQDVADAYDGLSKPKMIAWIHTHPNGRPMPSPTDREDATMYQRCFANALGTNDFEYYNGIHAFDTSRRSNATVDEYYVPQEKPIGASWTGPRFTHTLAMWDPEFKTPYNVKVISE